MFYGALLSLGVIDLATIENRMRQDILCADTIAGIKKMIDGM